MKPYEDYLKDGILLEQFVTKKCNFKCAHCMYNCGPDSSNEFVSGNILGKLKKQVDFLQSLEIPVTINILGGEPTLFFDKLDNLVSELSSWGVGIMMSTNGWWLEKEETTDKFFNIFGKLVSKDGDARTSNNGHGLITRISSEQYHIPFQQGNNNKEYFASLFDTQKYKSLVPYFFNPWISWQQLSGNYFINPQGRGRKVSNAREYIKKYKYEKDSFCWNEFNFYSLKATGRLESIHYELDGSISDTCMFGSDYSGIGTIDDNVLYIIGLLKYYKAWRCEAGGYNCYNCRKMFKKWMDAEMPEVVKKLSFTNNFDTDMWKMIIKK